MSLTKFNPIKQAIADRGAIVREGRSNQFAIGKKRICWSCMSEKPLKGGSFPSITSSRASPNERFMCYDCAKKKGDK